MVAPKIAYRWGVVPAVKYGPGTIMSGAAALKRGAETTWEAMEPERQLVRTRAGHVKDFLKDKIQRAWVEGEYALKYPEQYKPYRGLQMAHRYMNESPYL